MLDKNKIQNTHTHTHIQVRNRGFQNLIQCDYKGA